MMVGISKAMAALYSYGSAGLERSEIFSPDHVSLFLKWTVWTVWTVTTLLLRVRAVRLCGMILSYLPEGDKISGPYPQSSLLRTVIGFTQTMLESYYERGPYLKSTNFCLQSPSHAVNRE